MRHIKTLTKTSTPALAGSGLSGCYEYLLSGDFSSFWNCKVGVKYV
ncbi:MAG: hypothetical protein K1Y02_09775 [Candidatus Hydrogenedentes bacterium]|nr:hypothetical protein [Candidatus Hydrogenedentota bacterium]